MMSEYTISEEVVAGASPEDEESVRNLAKSGFKAILNLRPTDAPAQFSSRDEGLAAAEAGLTYLCFPVAEGEVDDFHVRSLHSKLKLLPKPVFMHGDNSSSAAALGILDRAVSENWTADEAVQRARELGVEVDDASFRGFVERASEA